MNHTSASNPPETSVTNLPGGRRRRRLAIAVGGLALVGLAGWWFWQGGSTPATGGAEGRPGFGMPGGPGGPGGGRPSPVVAEAAAKAVFPVRLSAIGTVVPRTVVTVRSRVDGTLNRVNFVEGQNVRAGDLLAEIDPRPFEVALAQAQGQLARDEALLANARADLARYEGLAKLDAIPSQQLDTQRALVRQYEAAVKVDQGTVDNARLQLSYTRVTAPNDGRVGLRQVDPGNLVRSSDSGGIVVITQVQPVTVVFPVPEADLGKLLQGLGLQGERSGAGNKREAQARTVAGEGRGGSGKPSTPAGGGRLAVEAWDREGKVLLATGELLTVDNQLDVTTGTVKVKAIFANRDGTLFPNQFVNVRLVVSEIPDAVVIPSAAVLRGAKGTFVWLLKEDGTVSMRPVEAGAPDGERIQIVSGVAVDEKVVVDGFDRLREGAKVEVVSRESRNVKEGGGSRRGPRPNGAAASGSNPPSAAPPAPAAASTPRPAQP